MSRVLLLTMSLGPGGAEDQAFRLSTELRRRGWEPAMVSLLPLSSQGKLKHAPPRQDARSLVGHALACPESSLVAAREAELIAAGIPVFSLGMRAGKADPRALARLAAIVGCLRPQVIHSHMFHANLLARIVRLLCPAPVLVSTLHSAAEGPRDGAGSGPPAALYRDPRLRLRDWAYRLTDCLADSVVAVSRAAAERHATSGAVGRKKLRVIPNAVDTGVFRPDPDRRARTRRELGLDSRFVWLAAGRLMWKKDYPTMLRAMERCPGSVLLVAGEGPQEAELKELAAELRVDARFLGRVSDVPALMNAADALVLSSVVEGLPMVLLEAAASGLPTVATNVGGACEVVAEGETGLLVPPGDPALLGNAMSRLQSLSVGQGSQPALPAQDAARGWPGALPRWEAMSSAARATAARFDTGVIVSQWDALYRELLENSLWT